MSRYPKNRSNLEELLVKIDNLLRSLEKDKTEVKREGMVRDVRGIRGVHMNHYFLVKSLTDSELKYERFRKKDGHQEA